MSASDKRVAATQKALEVISSNLKAMEAELEQLRRLHEVATERTVKLEQKLAAALKREEE